MRIGIGRVKVAFLVVSLAVVVAVFGTGGALGSEVRIGNQASGTLSWVLHAMEYFGIDKEYGLTLKSTTYATKQATEIALRAGDVDIVVDDFLGPALMRSQGIPVRAVYPFSLATGGIVVPVDGPQSIADLRGLRIAAASFDDKSLLILRALATTQYGFDPQIDGRVLAASPPLMSQLLERGEIDVAIPYWHFVARLVGTGRYRDLMPVTEMLAALGLRTDLPILVIVARDGADPEVVRTFLRAFNATTERMKGDDGVWQSILDHELYSIDDPALFPSVRARWESGLSTSWTQETVDGLVALVERLVEVAGEEILGVKVLDRGAFTLEFAP